MYYLKAISLSIVAMLLWLGLIFLGALMGWWSSAIAPSENARQFMDSAIELAESTGGGDLVLVLLEDGVVFDEYYEGAHSEIDSDTIFQTASLSKWITATGVMKLVESGQLDLDRTISEYLTRWQLPHGDFDNEKVTARLLLSHTAGLTDGLGFGEYLAEEKLPTLEESLIRPRASGLREAIIKVGAKPGAEFRYSGGGYLILQLLIEEITGETFQEFMQHALFDPLGMTRSTFGNVAGWENTSHSYGRNGDLTPQFHYAAKAATGFAASSKDMVRFVQSLISIEGSIRPLQRATIDAMRIPHASVFGTNIWGLGTMLYAPTESDDYIFGHDGQNDPALNAAIRVNPDTGDALISFVSGNHSLATRLGYEWTVWQTQRPDFLHTGAVIRDAFPTALLGIVFIVMGTTTWLWRIHASLR